VERYFAEITRKRIRRGTFRNVSALIAAINDYVRQTNADPKPLVWPRKQTTFSRRSRSVERL
jgi:hypothetical protein